MIRNKVWVILVCVCDIQNVREFVMGMNFFCDFYLKSVGRWDYQLGDLLGERECISGRRLKLRTDIRFRSNVFWMSLYQYHVIICVWAGYFYYSNGLKFLVTVGLKNYVIKTCWAEHLLTLVFGLKVLDNEPTFCAEFL